MQLSDWLLRERVKRIDFAVRAGISPSYLTDICSGACWPSRKVMLAVERETQGEVTANDFTRIGEEEGAA